MTPQHLFLSESDIAREAQYRLSRMSLLEFMRAQRRRIALNLEHSERRLKQRLREEGGSVEVFTAEVTDARGTRRYEQTEQPFNLGSDGARLRRYQE